MFNLDWVSLGSALCTHLTLDEPARPDGGGPSEGWEIYTTFCGTLAGRLENQVISGVVKVIYSAALLHPQYPTLGNNENR